VPDQQLIKKGGLTIPTQFRKYVQSGWDPTPVEQLRMVLLGQPGHGKTTFGMSVPRGVLLDLGSHARDVPQPKAHRVTCPTLREYLDFVELLEEDARSGDPFWKVVIIDTLDQFAELVIQGLTTTHNEEHPDKPLRSIVDMARGTGWYLVRVTIMGLLTSLHRLGYGWIVSGHIGNKTEYAGERSTRYKGAVLAASIVEALSRECNVRAEVRRLPVERQVKRTKTIQFGKQAGQRKVVVERVVNEGYFLLPRPGLDQATPGAEEDSLFLGDHTETKTRYFEYMPERVELSPSGGWSDWATAYTSAVDQTRASMEPSDAPVPLKTVVTPRGTPLDAGTRVQGQPPARSAQPAQPARRARAQYTKRKQVSG
jgi:hypothetical protein